MSDNEVRELKDYVTSVKEELLKAIADLRVHLAEDYVSKKEFTLYKQEQSTGQRSGISNTLMGAGILISMVISMIGLFVK